MTKPNNDNFDAFSGLHIPGIIEMTCCGY